MSEKKNYILVPISSAELMDKIIILEIKAEKIADPKKNKNIRHELEVLRKVFDKHGQLSKELNELIKKLRATNRRGWEIEDQKRVCERNKDFGPKFLKAARAAFKNNDERAALWKAINLLLESDIIQEKLYESY